MGYIVGNKFVGRDNSAVGSVKGRENQSAAVVRGVPFLEAQYYTTPISATISRSSNVATVSCTAHGLTVRNIVRIVGAAQPEYNGHHRVETVADANTLTYTVYGEPAASATGTITAAKVHQETIGD